MEIDLESQVLDMLRHVGISRGRTVLDFGCGYGAYTIPVAEIVGRQGIVYALDKDKEALDALTHRGQLEGLNNIRRIETSGELEIGLADESVDIVLLFDVFHSFYFPDATDRRKLLGEIHRVMKPSAFLLISSWPGQMDPKVEDEIKNTGFRLEKGTYGILAVTKGLETCRFLKFRKAC